MLALQAPESSPWGVLRLEAGLLAGNGIEQETDSRRDFAGRLSAAKSFGRLSIGGGFSYYYGGVYQGNENVYRMSGGGFRPDDSPANKGRYARREYFGFDLQAGLKTAAGATKLHAEYLFGRQPGTAESSGSPNSSLRPEGDTYLRDFRGGYVMLVQSLGELPVSAVAKFDWYDPNTKVSRDDIGHGTGTGAADIGRHTWGFGALWDIFPSLRLTVFYEKCKNEMSAGLDGYGENRKDDSFTFRLQYKF